MMENEHDIRDEPRKRSSRVATRQMAEGSEKLPSSRLQVSEQNERTPGNEKSLPGGTSRIMLSRLALGKLTRRRGMPPQTALGEDVSETAPAAGRGPLVCKPRVNRACLHRSGNASPLRGASVSDRFHPRYFRHPLLEHTLHAL